MINVKKIVEEMPEKPGIYIMKNEDNQVIYVGKAKKLKKRVSQYFTRTEDKGIKTVKLVSNIRDIEYIVTDSEEEALILECNFIKKYKPRYNILLKDDKTYPYAKLTINETFPRLFCTRHIDKDGAKYYGPFPNVEYIKNIIEILSCTFKVRRCNYRNFNDIKRPCINYDIGLCSGPCKGKISKEEYGIAIEKVIKFLEGNHKEVLELLENQMNKFSQDFKFEEAAKVRDQIECIKSEKEKQKITNVYEKDKDYIAIEKDSKYDVAIIQIFNIRDGKFLDRKHFLLEKIEETFDEELLLSFLKQYYLENVKVPSEIIVDLDIESSNFSQEYADIEKALTDKEKRKVKIYNPKIGKNKKLLILARKNAKILLEQYISKTYQKEEVIKSSIEELRNLLNLDRRIERIESYDISNISGVDNVGAMVVFENGLPKRSEYRKFKIKTIEGANDIGCMKEVIERRFTRYLEKDKKFDKLPDLIMMDGGENQVRAAIEILSKLKIVTNVCGLVKDDNHRTSKIYYNDDEINIDKRSELFMLITRIQDEVHRSAISYFKKLHNKNMIKSELDDIAGIGEKKKLELINHFKNVENIRNATISELMEVKGINESLAKAIKEKL